MLVLDERVLRHIFIKKDLFGALPTTHSITKMASRQIEQYVCVSICHSQLQICYILVCNPVNFSWNQILADMDNATSNHEDMS